MTPMIDADEIAQAFNTAGERNYWSARVSSGRGLPAVNFNSRSSMVKVTYFPTRQQFHISFSRTACAFGDFMASAFKSLTQILLAMKAAGMDVAAPLDDTGCLRLEYDHTAKTVTCQLAKIGDDWQDTLPVSFKVLENNLS